MVSLNFSAISEAINKFHFPDVDLVIGIANGGVVPASLIANRVSCDMNVIRINYRLESNEIAHESPIVLCNIPSIDKNVKKILIVDDVSVSGSTLNTAVSIFNNYEVQTCVLKGNADFVLFPTIKSCVNWPWRTK